MHLKVKTIYGHRYAYIVRSSRMGRKVSQKTVCYLGRMDDLSDIEDHDYEHRLGLALDLFTSIVVGKCEEEFCRRRERVLARKPYKVPRKLRRQLANLKKLLRTGYLPWLHNDELSIESCFSLRDYSPPR